MPKPSLSFALASQPLLAFAFSGTTGTSSQYLPAAGGVAGDGLPVPYAGTVAKLIVFDGSTTYTDTDNITFAANDRLSVYCQSSGGVFSVKVRINGVSTALQVNSVPLSSTLLVTVIFAINRV